MKNRKGSALLLVLWAVMVVAAVVAALARTIGAELDESVLVHRSDLLRLEAESGLALARHPDVKPDSELLHREGKDGAGYDVEVSKEAARIDINYHLGRGDVATLNRLFENWGLSISEAETVTDRLADWMDSDSLSRLHGAESEQYAAVGRPDEPTNRPFRSVEEMRRVLGVAEALDAIHPGWEGSFTVFSNSGVDVSDAQADVIAAVAGISVSTAESFVDFRRGRDGKDMTEDDVQIKDFAAFRSAVGLGETQAEQVQGLVTLNSPLVRMESTGHLGNRRLTLIEIATRGMPSSQRIVRWEVYEPKPAPDSGDSNPKPAVP